MTSQNTPGRGAAGGGARPRVFIVDDHGLFRSGVRMELGTDVDVIGEAADVDSAVEQIGAQEPDVVLLDVHLPGGGGQAVVSAIRQAHPKVRFLALSASDAPEDVIAVIRAGARGYVTKTISGDELVTQVIGDVEPAGLCGSGLVDAVAELVAAGVIDHSGRFVLGSSSNLRTRVAELTAA